MPYHVIVMVDGTVGIMQTVGDATPEQCLAKWAPAEQARVVSHQPIDVGMIPADRTRRKDWRWIVDHIEIVDP